MKQADEQGYVTAETAVALPALVFVLCAVVWAVGAVTAQVKCIDAARAGARAMARGEPAAAGHAAAVQAAPGGAGVAMSRGGGLVHVRVTASVEPPGPVASVLPGIQVRGAAAAAVEGTDEG